MADNTTSWIAQLVPGQVISPWDIKKLGEFIDVGFSARTILEAENRELHIKLESCQRDLSAISAGFTAANTRINELAKFTFHGLDCDIYRGHFGSGECTCGLGKLITPPEPTRTAEKESNL